MDPTQVIIRPVLSEKTFALAEAGKYTFRVHDKAHKTQIRQAIDRLMQGRTSIIIAHRLSTIQKCDKIIVMHKGRVREMGTHQQLLAQRGIYYKLYQLQ